MQMRRESGRLRHAMVAGFFLMALFSVWQGRKGPEAGDPVRLSRENHLEFPAAYREWIFLGAAVTPHELNNGRAAFPGIHHLYIEPAAFAHYRRTGEFRDGTMLAKELISVESRQGPSGRGFFPGQPQGLGISLKSRALHPEAPGHWGFYYFGSVPPDAESTGLQPEETCARCHLAGDQELIFTRYYPALRPPEPP